MNTLCFVLVMLCIVALLSNNIDALQLCYEMGKGTAYTDATQKSFLIKTMIRAVDMNILLIAGILLIIVVSKINKGLVFDLAEYHIVQVDRIFVGYSRFGFFCY